MNITVQTPNGIAYAIPQPLMTTPFTPAQSSVQAEMAGLQAATNAGQGIAKSVGDLAGDIANKKTSDVKKAAGYQEAKNSLAKANTVGSVFNAGTTPAPGAPPVLASQNPTPAVSATTPPNSAAAPATGGTNFVAPAGGSAGDQPLPTPDPSQTPAAAQAAAPAGSNAANFSVAPLGSYGANDPSVQPFSVAPPGAYGATPLATPPAQNTVSNDSSSGSGSEGDNTDSTPDASAAANPPANTAPAQSGSPDAISQWIDSIPPNALTADNGNTPAPAAPGVAGAFANMPDDVRQRIALQMAGIQMPPMSQHVVNDPNGQTRIVTTDFMGHPVTTTDPVGGGPTKADQEALLAYQKNAQGSIAQGRNLLQSVSEARAIYGDGSKFGAPYSLLAHDDGSIAHGGVRGFLTQTLAPADSSALAGKFSEIGVMAKPDGGNQGVQVRTQKEFSAMTGNTGYTFDSPQSNLLKLDYGQAAGNDKVEYGTYMDNMIARGVSVPQAEMMYNNFRNNNPIYQGPGKIREPASPQYINLYNTAPRANTPAELSQVPSHSYVVYQGKLAITP